MNWVEEKLRTLGPTAGLGFLLATVGLFRDVGAVLGIASSTDLPAGFAVTLAAGGLLLIGFRLHQVAQAVSDGDRQQVHEVAAAFDRRAFAERAAADEDLRAMFAACNEARIELQKHRSKIRNRVVAALLGTLDNDFKQIRDLSPWAADEIKVGQDAARLRADRAYLEEWERGAGKAILASLPKYYNPTAQTVLFYEVRAVQQRIVGVVEGVKRITRPGLLP